jgi:23S rRNA pseudouridine2605 synthase
MSGTTRSEPREERLQKILAAAGIASRRASEDLIRAVRVSVNGDVASLGQSANRERDTIAVDGEPIHRESLEYWIVHKPRGVLTTVSDPRGRSTVMELLPKRGTRLFPVGRLDFHTEGLVLLTNDGALAHTLLHPSFGTEREYQVTVRGRLQAATLRRIAKGVPLEDGVTAPARLGVANFDPQTRATRFALTLIEGKKRQIRRMMGALGHPVVRLVRVRMGTLQLGRLGLGEARPLQARERRALLAGSTPPNGAKIGRADSRRSRPRN